MTVAVTSYAYAVQGATFARSTSAISPGATRAGLYVDMTRGRRSNTVLVVAGPVQGEAHLPKLVADVEHQLESSLAKPAERTAAEVDPDALAVGAASRADRWPRCRPRPSA